MLAMLIGDCVFAADNRARATLQWHRSEQAEGCLDASALSSAVESGLGRTVFVAPEQADLIVKVNLERPDAEHWLAQIDLQDNTGRGLGHRELSSRGESCTSINESLALIVSLMVDVTRESLQPPPPAPPVSPIPPPAPAIAPAPPRPNPPSLTTDKAKSPWRGDLLLLGTTSDGQPHGVLNGISVAAELGPGRFWLMSVRVTAWAPKQTGNGGAGAKFWLGTAEADLCGVLGGPRLDPTFCVGPEVGALNVKAVGFDVNRAEVSMLVNLVARLSATWWATQSLGLHFGLAAGFPLVQREYYGTAVDGSKDRLVSRPWLVPMADFGIALRLGQ